MVAWWPVSRFGSYCGCRGMVARLVAWWWWHGDEAGVWIGAVIDSHRGGDCLLGC